MKRLLYAIPALIFASLFFAPHAHAAYLYSRAITVTSTGSIASGTNANFPMLVSSTITSWKTATNGGNVQNLTTAPNGMKEPADFVFATSPTNCTSGSFLNYETLNYTSSTGAYVGFVQVPSLTAGSVIYACYDNSSITTDQSHPSSTWSSQYLMVCHFPSPTILQASDSTANANNAGFLDGTTVQAGYIGGTGSAYLNGTYIAVSSTPSLNSPTSTLTISLWAYQSAVYSNGYQEFVRKGTPYYMREDTSNDVALATNNNYNLGGASPSGVLAQVGWHLYTAVYGNGTTTVYLDGIASFVNGSNSNITPTSATNLDLGALDPVDGGPGQYFYGNEDEVYVINGALSSSWVLSQYKNQSSPSTFYSVGAETAISGGGSTPIQLFFNWIASWDW